MPHPRWLGCLALWAASLVLPASGTPCWAEVPEPSPEKSEAKTESEPEADAPESPQRQAEARIRHALATPVSVDFHDTPLDVAIAFLADDRGIPMLLDTRALTEVGMRPEEPVSLQASEITLASVLRLMLRPVDLTYAPRHEVLLITTPEEEESLDIRRVYPVGDIVASDLGMGQLDHDFQSLVDLITTAIRPETWGEGNSFPGGVADFVNVKALVIAHSAERHEEIASLLAALRGVGDQTAEGKIADPILFDRVWPEPPAYPAVRRALKRKISVDFQESPLDHVVDYLREASGVNVVLDRRALQEVDISPDVPVSFRAADVTLASALRLMLGDLGLTYQVWDEVILITTPEEAEMRLTTGVYPVADLVLGHHDPCGVTDDFSSLETVITATVSPDRWCDVGGPGVVAPAPFERVEALVISQTCEVHEEVGALLEAIRGIAGREGEGDPGKPVMLDDTGPYSPAGQAVLKALGQKVTVDLREVPLTEMAEFVNATYGIEVRLDETALDEVGIPVESPVTLRASGITLRSALRLLLRPLHLTWVVDQGTLVITTPEDAERRLIVGIYPVGDLVVYRDENGELWDDYDSLIELIVCAVVPHAWENVGGPGAVDGATFGSAKVLVVRQTEQIHEQVRQLLGQLRRVAATSGGDGQPPRRIRFQWPPGLPGQMGGGFFPFDSRTPARPDVPQ